MASWPRKFNHLGRIITKVVYLWLLKIRVWIKARKKGWIFLKVSKKSEKRKFDLFKNVWEREGNISKINWIFLKVCRKLKILKECWILKVSDWRKRKILKKILIFTEQFDHALGRITWDSMWWRHQECDFKINFARNSSLRKIRTNFEILFMYWEPSSGKCINKWTKKQSNMW